MSIDQEKSEKKPEFKELPPDEFDKLSSSQKREYILAKRNATRARLNLPPHNDDAE